MPKIKRRRRRSKRARKSKRVSRPFSRVLFGNRLPVKMRYFTSTTLDPGASQLVANNVYSANGIWDADVTGGAFGQPRGFDQLVAMYDHYTVIGSRISVKFTPAAATVNPTIVGIQLKDRASTTTSLKDIMESRNRRSHYMKVDGGTTVSKIFSARKFLGRPHPLSEDDLRGSSTSNPAEQAYFHVWCTSAGTGVDSGVININVTIDYSVVFTEPSLPAAST